MTLREEFVFLALLRRCKRGVIYMKLCDKKVVSWWWIPPNFYANTGIVQSVLKVIAIIYKCFCTTNEFRTLDTFCLKTRRFSSFHNPLYYKWLWKTIERWGYGMWENDAISVVLCCHLYRFIDSSQPNWRVICVILHSKEAHFFWKSEVERDFIPVFCRFIL